MVDTTSVHEPALEHARHIPQMEVILKNTPAQHGEKVIYIILHIIKLRFASTIPQHPYKPDDDIHIAFNVRTGINLFVTYEFIKRVKRRFAARCNATEPSFGC